MGQTTPNKTPITHGLTNGSPSIFANNEFGYRRITVERPLRLNFAATPERIARLEDEKAFQNLAKSNKRPGPLHDSEVAEGRARQQQLLDLLELLGLATDGEVIRDREAFLAELNQQAQAEEIRLSVPERKAILAALAERDPQANICRDRRGNPEPDPERRDTENVPLGQDIDDYMTREVLPHAPDAWMDDSKTKIGYEIPLNRYFYVYEPPRPLKEIDRDLQALEQEIIEMLAEVTT